MKKGGGILSFFGVQDNISAFGTKLLHLDHKSCIVMAERRERCYLFI